MRTTRDVTSCRWALVADESLGRAARESSLFVASVSQAWFACSPDEGSHAAWDVLQAKTGAALAVKDSSDEAFRGDWLVQAAHSHATWLMAARGWPLMERSGKYWGGDGVWELQVVLSGSKLYVGWCWSEADWHILTPEEVLRRGAATECLVGGRAEKGVYVGVAECSPQKTQAVLNSWCHRFNLRGAGPLAKVLIRGELEIAPLEFVFVKNAASPLFSGASLRGLMFVNQCLQVAKTRRGQSEQNLIGAVDDDLTTPSNAMAMQEDVLDRDDLDLDQLPRLTQGFDGVDEEKKDGNDDSVWCAICSNGLRADQSSSLAAAFVRELLVGRYPPLGGIVARSGCFGQEWMPRTELDPSPLKSSRNGLLRKRHKVASAEHFLMEEDPVAPPKGRPGSQFRAQWSCKWSRELLWRSKREPTVSDCLLLQPPVSLFVSLGGLEKSTAPPPWREVTDFPKVRAKWDLGQTIEMDESALVLWDKLRLAPIVPSKKVAYVAVCGRGMDRGVGLFFSDVSSVWTSHLLGSHVPEAAKPAVVELSDEVEGGDGEAFLSVVRRFLSGVDVASAEAIPLIVYLVWPSRLDAAQLMALLEEFNEGWCARDVIVQVVPEDLVLRPARWSVQEMREFVLQVFSRIRVYKMASCEPAFLTSHPLLGDRLSLHVAVCYDEESDTMAAAAADPSGEVWACDHWRNCGSGDLLHSWLSEFVQRNTPRVPRMHWEVTMLDCSPVPFLGSATNGQLPPVLRVRNNLLFPVPGGSSMAIATVGEGCHVIATRQQTLLLEGASRAVAEELLVMMASLRGCVHIDFVRQMVLHSKEK